MGSGFEALRFRSARGLSGLNCLGPAQTGQSDPPVPSLLIGFRVTS